MRRNKKKNKLMILVVILLAISIGFAAMATTLKINGLTNVLKPSWQIYWANPVVSQGSVSDTLPTIGEDTGDPENTKVTWQATLALPGDYYEFTLDAMNTGSVDATISNIESITYDSSNNPTSLPNYIVYTVTYDDGAEVALNQSLEANSSKKYKIRVEYDYSKMTRDDINNMPAGGLTYTFSYKVTYSVASNDVYKSNLRVGEYFYLCADDPTAYTNYEGFSGSTPTKDQCLWRVIRVNGDGSADAVSHYVSTNGVTIGGVDGYKNLVAGLNDISSHYAKQGYTIRTRHIGYDGQSEVIKDTYKINGAIRTCPSTTSTPLPTEGTGEEYEGGVLGDTLYLKDYLVIKNLYGNILGWKYGGASQNQSYVFASRYYEYRSSSECYLRMVQANNYWSNGTLGTTNHIRSLSGGWTDRSEAFNTRPIITVRSGLYTDSGEGRLDKPYRLNARDGWFLTNDIEPLADQKSEYWENGTKIMNGWRYDLTDRSGRPNTYYFKDGYCYKGWLELDGKKYYLSTFDDDGNGYMDNRRFNGETREIDGVEYTFDANGVCTNCN